MGTKQADRVYELIRAQAERQPDALAIAAPGRAPLSYRRLLEQVEYVVGSLNEMGVGRNDRVAIVLPNGPEMALAFLAVAAGATSAPLNPGYGQKEFDFYLADLDARALIVQAGLDTPARAAAAARRVPVIELSPQLGAEAGVFTLSGSRAPARSEPGFAAPQDIALVLHTSGTTSRPKIVPLTHANICASARHISQTLSLAQTDRCLNVMPLFHIHGLMGVTLSSITAGASIVCTPGFDSARFFEWMGEFRPTWYSAVPTMHQAILASAPDHQAIVAANPLRLVRSSSASLPPRVMAELERLFQAPVIESYGMTEASHQMASNPLPPLPRKPGSVGPAAGPQIAIMDQAGGLLPQGVAGEVVIRGPNVMHGYENNPTANQGAFSNGWFRTGDEGYLDEQGYLFLTGRIKEMINRGGEKIAPRQVDEVFLEHPQVAQAVAFAIPHETLGEDLAMAVVLKQGTSVSEQELRSFAFERLVGHKVPSQVLILDSIPKGPTGKLQRIGLHEKLADQLQATFQAPRDDLETTLHNLWSEVLPGRTFGIYDNFFALGGDSLSATRLNARIRASFQLELPLDAIFREPTIAGQAVLLMDMLLDDLEDMSEADAQRAVQGSESLED